MTDRERLKKLIDDFEQPTIIEWVFEVEEVLKTNKDLTKEADKLIKDIKQFRNDFGECDNLLALLKQLYKRKYDSVELPPITK